MKIVSLNVEYGKHFDKTRAFLTDAKADVYCFQEMPRPHFEELGRELGYYGCYKERSKVIIDWLQHLEQPVSEGIAILSRNPMIDCESFDLHELQREHMPERYPQVGSIIWGAQMAKTEIEGDEFTIFTVHLPVSSRSSEILDDQREALQKFLAVVNQYDEVVISGDINSPRGFPIYDEIAKHYTDNIPEKYKTSMDINLHKAGKKDPEGLGIALIDGLFTSPHYKASCIELISGVSDHMAVVGNVEKGV